jgi:hypothetical protein
MADLTLGSLVYTVISNDNLFWQLTLVLFIMGVVTSGVMYSAHKSNKLVKNDMIFYTVVTPFVGILVALNHFNKLNHTASNISKFLLLSLIFIMFLTNLLKKENFSNFGNKKDERKQR